MNNDKEKRNGLLKNRNIRILWLGQLVSEFGDSLHNTAMGFYILELTNSSFALGLVEAFGILPRVFLSLVAGVFADRYSRKTIIVIVDLIRALVLITFGGLAIGGLAQLWMIIVVAFILGCCDPFFDPAVASIKPDLVEKKHLIHMNSLFSLSSQGIWMVGRALAGVLVQLVGAPILILANGISFLVSGVSERAINLPEHKVAAGGPSIWIDLKMGFRYAYQTRGLRVQYLFILFLNFFSKVGTILMIPFFASNFTNGPIAYGLVMVIGSLGFMVGAAIAPKFKFGSVKRSSIYVMCMILVGSSRMMVPLCTNLIIIASLFFVSGMFISLANIIGSTVLQVRIPKNMRGKVYGFRRTLNTALLPLGAILGGILGEWIGINVTIIIAYSMCTVIGALLSLSKSHKAFFNYDAKS